MLQGKTSGSTALDYDETFRPVMRQESLRTLVALSTQLELELHHVDVVTAFLNRTLQEQPQGYERKCAN